MQNSDAHDYTASSGLQQLFADEWEFRMQENPLLATRCGDHRFNERLPAVSEEDYQRRLAQTRVFVDTPDALMKEVALITKKIARTRAGV